MLDNKKVNEFIDELASNSPAPGGGSVAALSASIGAALTSMVFSLTVGKKAYKNMSEEDQQRVNITLEDAQTLKDEFLNLMNKDTEEFMEVMKAYKLPKESDEEKALRKEKIEEAYKRAMLIPMIVGEKSFDMYNLIETACELGNKNAISDAGVAALMIQSAIEGAVLNVKINLTAISDEQFKNETIEKCNHIVNQGKLKCEKIQSIVNGKIGIN